MQLDKAVGNDAAYIRKLKTGRAPNPGCQTLARLALALELSADAFIDFDAVTQGFSMKPR